MVRLLAFAIYQRARCLQTLAARYTLTPMARRQLPALARLLRQLRGERYSLRDVERRTDAAVSNVYLSQLENGTRTDPHPRVLVALAKAYDVPVATLFEAAGYVDKPAPSELEVAFRQVLADRSFKFGTRADGELTDDAKRFIIELYERATRKTLLRKDERR